MGYRGVLSVGRVQTPILGLVVERDRTITEFVSKPYYQVQVAITPTDHETPVVSAQWQPSEACSAFQDEQGRMLNLALANNVVSRVQGQPAQLTERNATPKSQSAPLPLNLSSLQIEANKRFGLSAQQVLDTAQNLYERHKLITYPRSDCRYLPEAHHSQAAAVLAAVSTQLNQPEWLTGAEPQRRSSAWNDRKVEAHHAIIPTLNSKMVELSATERQVYQLVAQFYAAQFFPAYRYQQSRLTFVIAGGQFVAKAKVVIDLGWQQVFPRRAESLVKSKGEAADGSEDDETAQLLPDWPIGWCGQCRQATVLSKQTEPPAHFTDATLLAAMTGISRYVTDPDIKRILKETDGIGTEATRAGMIELLVKRGFIARRGKALLSTPAGQGLIATLPDALRTPDRTALWESGLEQIKNKQMSYQHFMEPMLAQLHVDIAAVWQQSSAAIAQASQAQGPSDHTARKTTRRKSSGYRQTASAGNKSKNTAKPAKARARKKSANSA